QNIAAGIAICRNGKVESATESRLILPQQVPVRNAVPAGAAMVSLNSNDTAIAARCDQRILIYRTRERIPRAGGRIVLAQRDVIKRIHPPGCYEDAAVASVSHREGPLLVADERKTRSRNRCR